MLALRVDGFTAPLAEVPLGPITPTVAIANTGDEGAAVTGLVRIYRISTGLQVYDSQLTPTIIGAGESAEVEALTAWLPPAPAVDDYFVNGWATATGTGCAKLPWSGNIPSFYFDITAPPPGPYPEPHAPTHEVGGSDPVVDLDHGGLSGLPDDDHPQYQLISHADPLRVRPAGILYETDFLHYTSDMNSPWDELNLGGGSIAGGVSPADHPGILDILSGVGANSGYGFTTSPAAFLLAGSEVAEFVFQIRDVTDTPQARFGFHDGSAADATDGVYLEILGLTVQGKTATNSVRSTTGTSYAAAASTWYRGSVALNSDASLATFSLYSEAGVLLWSDTLAANIPTAAGREVGHRLAVFNPGTTARTLHTVDWLLCWVARTLTR